MLLFRKCISDCADALAGMLVKKYKVRVFFASMIYTILDGPKEF